MTRYARQIILPEIGSEGQRRLSSAKVAVIGAGGLGSPVLYYLASAGVGVVHIFDSDTVELTNLNRQFIHFQSDIGREKSQSAKEKLERYNKDIQVSASTVRLDAENVRVLLAGFHLALSCVDNTKTRYLLNSACAQSGIPLVDGGIRGFEGYVLSVTPGVTPCYQCIFPGKGQWENADVSRQHVESAGVLGAAAGILGSMMALEAIKHIAGIPIQPHFYYVDLLSCGITPITAKRVPDCPACGI